MPPSAVSATVFPENGPKLGSFGNLSVPNLFNISDPCAGSIPEDFLTWVDFSTFFSIASCSPEGITVSVGTPLNSPAIPSDNWADMTSLAKSDGCADTDALRDGSNP